jgi:hypothetical protein
MRGPGLAPPGVTFNLADGSSSGGPCPAWPRWAQQLEMMRAELRKLPARRVSEPPAPAPKPIAVITLSGPIEDVTAKLAAIQAEHPVPRSAGASVTAGKSGRLAPDSRCQGCGISSLHCCRCVSG